VIRPAGADGCGIGEMPEVEGRADERARSGSEWKREEEEGKGSSAAR
jgi:hypothetical protein